MKKIATILILMLFLPSVKMLGQVSGVTITGNPNVGSVLTADPNGDPEGSNYLEYKWYYSSTLLGSNSTYTVQSSDQAHTVYVIISEMYDADSLVRGPFTSDGVVINSKPVASSPQVVGEIRAGMTVWAFYAYSDADDDPESGSLIQWYHDNNSSWGGASQISGATSPSYKISNTYEGDYIGFKITPRASSGSLQGDEVQTTALFLVLPNNAPQASNVSVSCTQINNERPSVNSVLTGNYTYSDYEGDLESSTFDWLRAATKTGTYTSLGENSRSHQVKTDEQGKYFIFKVTPKAATGNSPGTAVKSDTIGPVNTKPSAGTVTITGDPYVNEWLTGHYSYSDPDADAEDVSERVLQWYRGTTPILGATNISYRLTAEDVDKTIYFKVIPYSVSSVFPYIGDQVSSAGLVVSDPSSSAPVAIHPCISGSWGVDSLLTGQYTYQNSYSESLSYYEWFRNGVSVKAGSGETYRSYKMVAADIDKEIKFAVTPRNSRGQSGSSVVSAPLARFTLLRDVFSTNDDPQLLSADPEGGIFDGDGVTNGYYDPETAGVGKDTLRYVLTYPYTEACVQTVYQAVEVRPNTIQFYGVNNVYCDDHGTDTLYILNVPGTATFHKFEITDPSGNLVMISDTSAIFNPDLLQKGDRADAIYYSYIDSGVPFQLKQPLVIDHFASVSIINLKDGDQFCYNTVPFSLTTSHTPGVFTGPVENGMLKPSLVPGGYGDVWVKFKYTSDFMCSKRDSALIRINPLPQITFTVTDSCINDNTDKIVLNNTTALHSVDPVVQWEWKTSESGNDFTSYEENPGFLYKNGGPHPIKLTATTVNNCSSSLTKTFDLGIKPTAGFTWRNECYTAGDSIFFTDATISPSAVTSRKWIFNNSHIVNNKSATGYLQPTPGALPVSYIVMTSYAGCHDTITRDIYIRKSITVPVDGYFQDFEAGQGGWLKDYETRNTWRFGQPDRTVMNRAASGTGAWFTDYDLLAQSQESSSVISPCFDFTNIKRPMISLKIWKRFERNRDGAALQYKVGDAPDWEYIGSPDDGGIGWFNSMVIMGRPGGDRTGWTTLSTQDTTWSEARHKMDEVAGKKQVKFRLAYGSPGDTQDNEGFAFDDIRIGERTRNVLLEHFTNISSAESSQATIKVDEVVSTINKDIINIQYHTNFPGADAFYNENPADVSARVLYYGLIRSPYLFVDGGNTPKQFAKNYDYYQTELDSNDVISRSLVNPAFNIDLNTVVAGGILTVTGELRSLETRTFENLTLYIAVTEKENTEHTGALGETLFRNVFRKFIPDAGGINMKLQWNRGDSYSIDKSWIIQNIKNNADIEVIVFLQNNITREIYQAKSILKEDIASAVDDIPAREKLDFSIYPNPAVNKITLSFREELAGQTNIRVYDMRGMVVAEWMADPGITEFAIDDAGLQKGIYLVRLSMKGVDLGFRKLVIAGD